MDKPKNNVFFRDPARHKVVGNCSVGAILFNPYFSIVNAKVKDDALDSPLTNPTATNDQVLIVLVVERAIRLDPVMTLDVVACRVTRKDFMDRVLATIYLIH